MCPLIEKREHRITFFLPFYDCFSRICVAHASSVLESGEMVVQDIGLISYRDAWGVQEELHAQVAQGGDEILLLLEHPPVITLGRRSADSRKNLLASTKVLEQMGVEVVESDRGGDITFHGPGQLVAYPIVRLSDHGLSVGAYMRRLEDVVINAVLDFGIRAYKDDSAIGVWVEHADSDLEGSSRAKICALGVRIKRGVSLHGLALNLTSDLSYFTLINPCGLGRAVTSLEQLLGDAAPSMEQLKQSLARHFVGAFDGSLNIKTHGRAQ
jgi:lipoate-protein ligase B